MFFSGDDYEDEDGNDNEDVSKRCANIPRNQFKKGPRIYHGANTYNDIIVVSGYLARKYKGKVLKGSWFKLRRAARSNLEERDTEVKITKSSILPEYFMIADCYHKPEVYAAYPNERFFKATEKKTGKKVNRPAPELPPKIAEAYNKDRHGKLARTSYFLPRGFGLSSFGYGTGRLDVLQYLDMLGSESRGAGTDVEASGGEDKNEINIESIGVNSGTVASLATAVNSSSSSSSSSSSPKTSDITEEDGELKKTKRRRNEMKDDDEYVDEVVDDYVDDITSKGTKKKTVSSLFMPTSVTKGKEKENVGGKASKSTNASAKRGKEGKKKRAKLDDDDEYVP